MSDIDKARETFGTFLEGFFNQDVALQFQDAIAEYVQAEIEAALSEHKRTHKHERDYNAD